MSSSRRPNRNELPAPKPDHETRNTSTYISSTATSRLHQLIPAQLRAKRQPELAKHLKRTLAHHYIEFVTPSKRLKTNVGTMTSSSIVSVPPRRKDTEHTKSFAEAVNALKENAKEQSLVSLSKESKPMGSSSFKPVVENTTPMSSSGKPLPINKINPELARFCLF